MRNSQPFGHSVGHTSDGLSLLARLKLCIPLGAPPNTCLTAERLDNMLLKDLSWGTGRMACARAPLKRISVMRLLLGVLHL